jgi:hypothetical protein
MVAPSVETLQNFRDPPATSSKCRVVVAAIDPFLS